jgi:hypothetical protein
VSLEFVDCESSPKLKAREKLPARVRYYRGNNAKKWLEKVPVYREITYHGLYDGIDLTFTITNGTVRYRYIVDPGGDPDRIRMRCAASEKQHIDDHGNLVLETSSCRIVHRAPRIFEIRGKARERVKGAFTIHDDGTVGFKVSRSSPKSRLIIDPEIISVSFYPPSQRYLAYDMDVDAAGHLYAVGHVSMPDLDPSGGTQLGWTQDAYAMKVDMDAEGESQLLYYTYIGGLDQYSDNEVANGVVVDSRGRAHVAGLTGSFDFPVVGDVFQSETGHGGDGFITILAESGAIERSTYLGSHGWESLSDIYIIEDAGSGADAGIYVTGISYGIGMETGAVHLSSDFASLNVVIAKLDPELADLEFCTYFGGNNMDWVHGIAAAGGSVFITGKTESTDLPTTENALHEVPLIDPAFYEACEEGVPDVCTDAFACVLGESGNVLQYSTYLGGISQDIGASVTAARDGGSLWLTGTSESAVGDIGREAVSVQIDFNEEPPAVDLMSFGGASDEWAWDIAVDEETGYAYIAGGTSSRGLAFPAGAAFQEELGGGADAFIARINESNEIDYFSYFGGMHTEMHPRVVLGPDNALYLAGLSFSTELLPDYDWPDPDDPDFRFPFLYLVSLVRETVPDLNLIKSGAPDNVFVGGDVVYSFAIVNPALHGVGGAVFIDHLPPAITYSDISVSLIPDATIYYEEDQHRIRIVMGNVQSGPTSFDITGTVAAITETETSGELCNLATLEHAGNVVQSSYCHEEVIVVDPPPDAADADIEFILLSPLEPPMPGDVVTYRIIVTNTGDVSLPCARIRYTSEVVGRLVRDGAAPDDCVDGDACAPHDGWICLGTLAPLENETMMLESKIPGIGEHIFSVALRDEADHVFSGSGMLDVRGIESQLKVRVENPRRVFRDEWIGFPIVIDSQAVLPWISLTVTYEERGGPVDSLYVYSPDPSASGCSPTGHTATRVVHRIDCNIFNADHGRVMVYYYAPHGPPSVTAVVNGPVFAGDDPNDNEFTWNP